LDLLKVDLAFSGMWNKVGCSLTSSFASDLSPTMGCCFQQVKGWVEHQASLDSSSQIKIQKVSDLYYLVIIIFISKYRAVEKYLTFWHSQEIINTDVSKKIQT
jgi:hypothetical protein